jgi:mRNA interferase YafQ
VALLLNRQPLAAKYRNHKLVGNWVGYWECHLEPDWLLVYKIEGNTLILAAAGTHSDLFD